MTLEKLREKIAKELTDGAEIDVLEQFFYEKQLEWLESMAQKELEEYAKEILGYEVELKK